MPLPGKPNSTVDIYRGFDINQPVPVDGTSAIVRGVPAILKHHVKAGVFGYNDNGLHWTHLLLVENSVDIRTGYNSQLNTTDITKSDTVLLADCPNDGKCSPFYVVDVQVVSRKLFQCKKVYLDRALFKIGPCTQAKTGLCSACVDTPVPYDFKLTLSNDFTNNGCTNCASLNSKTYHLHNTGNCVWFSDPFNGPCNTQVRWDLGWNSSIFQLFLLTYPAGSIVLSFTGIATASYHCRGSNTFSGPVWLASTCSSSSSATITATL